MWVQNYMIYIQHIINSNDQTGLASLKSMDMQLLLLCQVNRCEKLRNIVTLVSLELNHLSILFIFNYCPVTVKLLDEKQKQQQLFLN